MIDLQQIGDKMYFSYVDEKGDIKVRYLKLEPKQMHNWVYCQEQDPKRSQNYRSWNGKPIKPVRSSYLDKFRQFDIIDQFSDDIQKEVFAPYKPKTFFMDIEVDVDSNGFPFPEIARMPVNTVAFSTPKNEVYVLSIKPLEAEVIERIERRINDHLKKLGVVWTFKFKYFETEYDLLTALANKIIPKMPAITGWYFVDFDWTYLVNRCKKYQINLAAKSSPTSTFNDRTLLPYHRLIYDYKEIYEKWDRSVPIKESGKLDWVAEHVLGVKKVKYAGTLEELWKKDLEDYVFYNAIDVCLVQELDKVLNTYATFQSIATVGRVPQLKAFSAVYITERLMHSKLKEKGMRLLKDPSRIIEETNEKGYAGAYVMEPIVGLHSLVATLDFASMYPMIMRQFNIGSEVYMGSLRDDGTFYNEKTRMNEAFNPDIHIKTAANTVFTKEEDSVLREIVTGLYDSRYDMKHHASDIKRELTMLKDLRKEMYG